MPRAGTVWMMRSLNGHPDLLAFGETCFFGAKYIETDARGGYSGESLERMRQWLRGAGLPKCYEGQDGGIVGLTRERQKKLVDALFSDLQPGATPADVFAGFCRSLLCLAAKQQAIEKTPHHINWTDRILRSFPEAKFIVMLRDPCEFMLSYKYQCGGCDAVRMSFERSYHPLGAAIVARRCLGAANRIAAMPEHRRLFVHLDDIREDPAGVLVRVVEFLGYSTDHLPAPPGKANSSFRRMPNTPPPDLGSDDRHWLRLIAGRQTRLAGYTIDRVSSGGGGVLRSYLSLPRWAWITIARFRKRVEGGWVKYLARWLR